jgi:hypothetical protein
MRRDYQIRVTAWERGIPQVSLDNPTVYRYASVLRDVAAAHRREDLTDPYLSVQRAVPAPRAGSEADGRLRQYRQLNLLSAIVLNEGFPGSGHHVSDVGHYLDHLVRPLGTIAENVFEEEEYRPAVEVSGMWSRDNAAGDTYPGAVVEVDEAALGKYSGWWSRPDTLVERDDREHLALIEAEAHRQGVQAQSSTDRDLYPSLSRLVYARQLKAETTDLVGLPPAPGLRPGATERLTRVARLVILARRTLEEQFQPGALDPNDVLSALVPVARSVGRRIL